MNQYTHLILRLAVALSMFGHGLARLPRLTEFAEYMTEQFEKTILPGSFVHAYSYTIAISELIIGIMLILGLLTRFALVGGVVLMLTLILGVCLVENYGALPSQFIHIAIFAFLLQYINQNRYSVDRLFSY